MSTLWTPDGEHQPAQDDLVETGQPSPEEIDQLRQQIANADAADIITNHCYGLFELAAIHLSQTPPHFSDATLAIDALAGVLTSCEGRLGVHESELNDALHQLRLAFVQVSVLKDEEQQL